MLLPFMADGIVIESTVYCIVFYLFVYVPFVLFYFKFWAVEQNLIPYVRQMVFTYIFIQGEIVDPYILANAFVYE